MRTFIPVTTESTPVTGKTGLLRISPSPEDALQSDLTGATPWKVPAVAVVRTFIPVTTEFTPVTGKTGLLRISSIVPLASQSDLTWVLGGSCAANVPVVDVVTRFIPATTPNLLPAQYCALAVKPVHVVVLVHPKEVGKEPTPPEGVDAVTCCVRPSIWVDES